MLNKRNFLRQIPWFVPLLAVYPVVYIAGKNLGQVSAIHVAALAVVFVCALFFVYGGLWLRARSVTGAGVGAVCVLVAFFAYPTARNWLGETSITISTLVGVVWALITIAVADRVSRSAWATREEISKGLTVASVVLLAYTLVPVVVTTARALNNNQFRAGEYSQPTGDRNPSERRDIYYIVLDGYARADVLEKYYGFRNSTFIDALRTRGFQVSEKSTANYNWTFLSLASTLNLGYLDDVFPSEIDALNTDRTVVYEGIRESQLSRLLKSHGYLIVHFQSTYSATSVNPHADREIKCEQQLYDNEFVRAIVEASWLSAFQNKAGVDLAECHVGNFRALGRIGSSAGPKFVFAHFIVPHHPYLFDREGHVLRNATISNQFDTQARLWEDKASYVSQLEYVNRLVLDAIDGINSSSRVKPVIVLASDHGPGLSAGLTSMQHAALRLANFAAYLLPDAPPDLVPNDGSAVNQFRRILSHYFNADLQPLPDHYFVSSHQYPFDLREVPTDRLRTAWSELDAGQSPTPIAAN